MKMRPEQNLSPKMRRILTNLYNYPSSITLYDYLRIFNGYFKDSYIGDYRYFSLSRSFNNLTKRGLVVKKKVGRTILYRISPSGFKVVSCGI